MAANSKIEELHKLEAEAERLRAEIYAEIRKDGWEPEGYYTLHHTVSGMLLGLVGAAASLIFNVVGSLIFEQYPLQLIRVYPTYPLGEAALSLDSGFALASGCFLYLCTGALYGIGFHLVLSRFFAESSRVTRFVIATGMGIALWLINYYAILSWVQPALFGGNWIVTMVPWWVAALTHLVFAWTMLAIDRWGKFEPYRPY